MKKIIISLLVLLIVNSYSLASTYTPTLAKIESVLYGFQYDTEDDNSRLERIETSVYGSSMNGNITTRIAKLKKDVSADLMGQEIEPKEDTFADENDNWVTQELVADANIQYPAVDELEKIVFNQTFTTKDIKQRLSDLEEKTFGKVNNDDLASRVDRLKAELKPRSFMDNLIAQSSNDYYYEDVEPIDMDYHLERYDSPVEFDYDAYNSGQTRGSFFPVKKANITTVENALLKRSYGHDTMNNRLARLENTMFGTRFDNDDEQTRINRISSAYKAQNSASKYDSNKFAQNMSTAVQIGSMLLMILACIL